MRRVYNVSQYYKDTNVLPFTKLTLTTDCSALKLEVTDSFNTPFETHLERERVGLISCAAHHDGKEGLRAFVEKRKPVFNIG